MNRLEGRVAIVTGASRGIGRATARLLAAEGAKVAVLSLTRDGVDKVVAEIADDGGTAIGIVCDVADPGQITSAVQQVVDAFGGVDILVNNAFDKSVVNAKVTELSMERLQRNFDTGPIAHLRLMQACYPHLKKSGAGRVINFASMAGVLGLAEHAPYSMAKEAGRALTRFAAREWGADGIAVNNVLPVANTFTKMPEAGIPAPDTPMAGMGSPEEDIAPVVLFLASRDSQFITGSSLTPDGGALIDSAR